MNTGSSTTNVIEAYPNVDAVDRYFLAFKYDSEFFNDIFDVVSSNSLNQKLSFPVENNFFDLISYHHKNIYLFRRRLREQETFKYTIKADNKNIKVRLHIQGNYFYFTAENNSGLLLTTNEYGIEHITLWQNGEQILEVL